MKLVCFGQKRFVSVGGQGISLICSILFALVIGSCHQAEGTPLGGFSQPENDLSTWLQYQAQEEPGQIDDFESPQLQGENEYWDAMLSHEGLNGQVQPKKKPTQGHLINMKNGGNRIKFNTREKQLAKRDLNGMSMSITHNLDILRRGLLRELNLRQREQDRKQFMENNKKFLNGIGRR